MTARFKTIIAWDVTFLVAFAAWTVRYQMKTIALTLVIGIIGTLLIFATEFVYSYRKAGAFKIGPVRLWLKAHIVGGIGGPLVILWHTGLNFHGFAGLLALLTAVVLASGLTGRYIYRNIPRSIKGQALSLTELQEAMTDIEDQLREQLVKTPEAAELMAGITSKFGRLGSPEEGTSARSGFGLWTRMAIDWNLGRLRTTWLLAKKYPVEHQLLKVLEKLEFRRLMLKRRMRTLDVSKAMLAKWKVAHVPLTLALFVGVMIHVSSILYYGKVWP